MAEVVYLLCAITSVVCSWLLLRAYGRTRRRLLFWVALCFAGLGVNNLMLFVDVVLLPVEVDLAIERTSVALAAFAVLLYGLIWDGE
jgi:hypothetical protein